MVNSLIVSSGARAAPALGAHQLVGLEETLNMAEGRRGERQRPGTG